MRAIVSSDGNTRPRRPGPAPKSATNYYIVTSDAYIATFLERKAGGRSKKGPYYTNCGLTSEELLASAFWGCPCRWLPCIAPPTGTIICFTMTAGGDDDDGNAPLVRVREFGQKGPFWDNYAIAQNVLHEDMDDGQRYRFDDAQRDRIMAHARQDASHAVLNTSSILDALTRIQRLLKVAVALLVIIAAVVIFK